MWIGESIMEIVEIKEKIVIKARKEYIANNGKRFYTEEECIEYEQRLLERKELKELIAEHKKKFKFNTLELYDMRFGEFNDYDIAYVTSEDEVLTELLKCYPPERRYGRSIEIQEPWDVVYPCWILIEEIDDDSNTRFTRGLDEIKLALIKTLGEIDKKTT